MGRISFQSPGDRLASLSVFHCLVCGLFLAVLGLPCAQANDPNSWTPPRWDAAFPGLEVNGPVLASLYFEGELVIAGNFTRVDGQTVNRIARWNGEEWFTFSGPDGIGMNGRVNTLHIHDGALIAGGTFTTAGGEIANRVARWDGQKWAGLTGSAGTGVSGDGVDGVRALASYAGDLVVAGRFMQAGGVTVNNIARWDGQEWSALAGPNSVGTNEVASVAALTVYDSDLIAGGFFSEMGGLTVNNIARWNGEAWAPILGPGTIGINASPDVLLVEGNDLYAGGGLGVSRWNGNEWSELADENGNGIRAGRVFALRRFAGDLVAGGSFIQVGTALAPYTARWDGQRWTGLGVANSVRLYNEVYTFNLINGELVAGGVFTQAGDSPAQRLAQWRREPTETEAVFISRVEAQPGQGVLVVALVQGLSNTPEGGSRARIEADSGESCDARVTPAGSSVAVFSCEIVLESPGIRSLTASYTGSAFFAASHSGLLTVEVSETIFQDRFDAQ